jgi:ketosteroid isomerase-like protein
MRISVVGLILAGLAASQVSSARGKQPESWQLQTREWRNLLADTKALDEFTALRLKYLEAFDRHDAPAMTAFYADDGVAVTPDGWFSGHDAIQQWYEFLFHRWQPSDVMWQLDRLTGTDNQAWGIGRWWCTVQSQNGPVSASGFWSTEYIREDNEWKIRSATYNIAGGISLRPASNTSAGQ